MLEIYFQSESFSCIAPYLHVMCASTWHSHAIPDDVVSHFTPNLEVGYTVDSLNVQHAVVGSARFVVWY